MVSEDKPGQIESAALGVAAAFPIPAFKTWISAYFRPAAAIKSTPASLGAAAKNLAIAGFLVGLVSGIAALVAMSIGGAVAGSAVRGGTGSLIGGGIGFAGGVIALVLMMVLAPIIYVIAGFAGSGVYFIIAKILGGKGSYTSQTHAFALVLAGATLLTLPFQLLGIIPFIGGIFSLATMVVGLFALYSYYRTIKEVHQLSSSRALAVVLLPVIIAVVLLVALMGIALLGFVNLDANSQISQSAAYWRGEAMPFAINDYSFGARQGYVTLQNNNAGGMLTVTRLEISDCDAYTVSTPIEPGATQDIRLDCQDGGVAAGGLYDRSVVISYTDSKGLQTEEYGTKNLVGKMGK